MDSYATLLMIGCISLMMYCGSILMISTLGGHVLLSVSDVVALAGLIICLANRRKNTQNLEYFSLFFVFTTLLVSFTLGVSLKYTINFDVPYELRILACFVLGVCGLIIAGSSYKMYNYNFMARWMFLELKSPFSASTITMLLDIFCC